ncbi:hypothetical protein [Streptomyces sp. NPDC046197]|uniref:hypothetical protein n=1 Tax=Streptomyces sp. NPDC046197 TaxID=3154337 RepID=UPI0033FC5847
MIEQFVHETTATVDATVPAGVALPLCVAKDLHSPASRTPEVAVPQMMGLRTSSAVRPHRHKVPLRRLTAVRG